MENFEKKNTKATAKRLTKGYTVSRSFLPVPRMITNSNLQRL